MNVIDTIYSKSFIELNEEQKEKAIDIMREIENQDTTPYWSIDLVNQMKEKLVQYGIDDSEILWSGFCSQGDGASISTESINAEMFLRKVKAWSKFKGLRKFISEETISLSVRRVSHHYYHEYCVSGNVEIAYCEDVTAKQEQLVDDLQTLITNTIRDLSRELYKDLGNENDYHNSDEALIELINANDYNFKVNSTGDVLGLA